MLVQPFVFPCFCFSIDALLLKTVSIGSEWVLSDRQLVNLKAPKGLIYQEFSFAAF